MGPRRSRPKECSWASIPDLWSHIPADREMGREEKAMDANRRAALSAGVLFIIATAASVAGTALSGPIVNGPDRLTRAATNANLLASGALLQLVAAGASVGVAISLYPVLK